MRRFEVMTLLPVVALWVGANTAWAQKTVAVAAGDCRSSELTGAMTQFHELLRSRLSTELYQPNLVYDIVRPQPQRGLEELQRQVESARTLFYAGQTERALDIARHTLSDLQRVSADQQPWATTVEALLIEALVYRGTGQKTEQAAALRRIARLEPTLKLDPNLYTPSYIALFEQVKRESARAKKVVLSVQSVPAGADVYVEGKKLGVTPLKQTLVAGEYQLALASAEGAGFVRTLKLTRDEGVVVDLVFETALSLTPPLCIQAESETEAVNRSARLAATIGTDRTVVFQLVSKPSDPPSFRAVLLLNGDEQRSGNVRPGSLSELADFVLTGKALPPLATQRAVAVKPPAPPPAETAVAKPPPVVERAAPELPRPPPAAATSPPEALLSAKTMPEEARSMASAGGKTTGWAKPVGWVTVGLGLAAAVTGTLVYVVGGGPLRAELDGLMGNKFSDRFSYIRSATQAAQRNTVASFATIGAGIGSILGGLFLALAWPENPAKVTAHLTPNGASVLFSQSF